MLYHERLLSKLMCICVNSRQEILQTAIYTTKMHTSPNFFYFMFVYGNINECTNSVTLNQIWMNFIIISHKTTDLKGLYI